MSDLKIKNLNNVTNYRKKRNIGPSIEKESTVQPQPIHNHNHNYYSQNNALTPFMKTVYFGIGAIAVISFIFGILALTGYINYNDIPVNAIDANLVKNSSKDSNSILLEDDTLSFQTSKVSDPQIEILDTGVNINQDIDMNSKSMSNVSELTLIDDNNKLAKLEVTDSLNFDLTDLPGEREENTNFHDKFVIDAGGGKYLRFRKNGDLSISGVLHDSSGGSSGNDFHNLDLIGQIQFKNSSGTTKATIGPGPNADESFKNMIIDTTQLTGETYYNTGATNNTMKIQLLNDGNNNPQEFVNINGSLSFGGSTTSGSPYITYSGHVLNIDARNVAGSGTDNNDAILFKTTTKTTTKTMTLKKDGSLDVAGALDVNGTITSLGVLTVGDTSTNSNKIALTITEGDATVGQSSYPTISTSGNNAISFDNKNLTSVGAITSSGKIEGGSLATNTTYSIQFPIDTNPPSNGKVLKASGTTNKVTTLEWADDNNDRLSSDLKSITNGIQFGPDGTTISYTQTYVQGYQSSDDNSRSTLTLMGDQYIYMGTGGRLNQVILGNTSTGALIKINSPSGAGGEFDPIQDTISGAGTPSGYAIRTYEKIYSASGLEGNLFTNNITYNDNPDHPDKPAVHDYLNKSGEDKAKIKISKVDSDSSYAGILYTRDGGFKQYKQTTDNDDYASLTNQYIRKVGDGDVFNLDLSNVAGNGTQGGTFNDKFWITTNNSGDEVKFSFTEEGHLIVPETLFSSKIYSADGFEAGTNGVIINSGGFLNRPLPLAQQQTSATTDVVNHSPSGIIRTVNLSNALNSTTQFTVSCNAVKNSDSRIYHCIENYSNSLGEHGIPVVICSAAGSTGTFNVYITNSSSNSLNGHVSILYQIINPL